MISYKTNAPLLLRRGKKGADEIVEEGDDEDDKKDKLCLAFKVQAD